MKIIVLWRIFFKKIFLRKVEIKQFGVPESNFQHRVHSGKLAFFHWLQQGPYKPRRFYSSPGVSQLCLEGDAEGWIKHWTMHRLLPEEQGSWPCQVWEKSIPNNTHIQCSSEGFTYQSGRKYERDGMGRKVMQKNVVKTCLKSKVKAILWKRKRTPGNFWFGKEIKATMKTKPTCKSRVGINEIDTSRNDRLEYRKFIWLAKDIKTQICDDQR